MAAKIVSAIASYVSGVAVLLPVAPEWWHAVLIALGTPLASQGLRDLLVDLVRWLAKKKGAAVVLLCLLIPAFDGCSVRHAQTSVQTTATSLAVALDRVDGVVAENLLDASEQAMSEASSRSNLDPSVNALEAYTEMMEPWDVAVAVMESLASALRLLQDAIDIWIESGNLPENVGQLCEAVGNGAEHLIEFLEAVGVDVPAALEAAPQSVPVMCTMISDFIQ